MPSVTHLIRPDVLNLEPYTPILPIDLVAERLGLPVEQIIKLDANENPYGPAPRALAALANEPHYAIYSDPEHTHLRRALSRYTNQPVERIICGCGADEIIDLVLRLLLQPGDTVITCPPTFGMYAFDTAVNGGTLLTIPRQPDFSLDIHAIEEAARSSGAKVLFIDSPNNPGGTSTPPADIQRLLRLPLLVAVDEAYIEFADPASSISPLVGLYENLVVMRTFSKWAGLAGLRIGYGLVPEALISHMWKIKQPYNVNQAAQVAALASLEDTEHLPQAIARIIDERERLRLKLQTLPWLHVYPSQTNFLLCRLRSGNAATLKHTLEQQGILVRYYNKPELQDCIRISIGTPEQNDRLLATLHAMPV